MATLIIPGAYMVAINAESGGQTVTNVIGVSGIINQAEQIALAVELAWLQTDGPLSQHPASYAMRSIRVTDLSSATGEVVERTVVGSGIQSGGLATNASCAIISYSNGSRSRSGRGRLYHGPLTETQMNPDGRTVTSSIITRLTTAYELFKSALEIAGYSWVVISRKLSTFTPVTSPACQALSGTQRRRLR